MSTETPTLLGAFNADSAYRYIEEQVAFGPRMPGTAAHDDCVQYIIKKLRSFDSDSVIVQRGVVSAFDGTELPMANIIAMYNPGSAKRVVLAAHYDTRPWSDAESDEDRRICPVLGANDGGSGVAVLLEIARNLADYKPNIGVDLIFFDCEDYGSPEDGGLLDGGWCLGSRYWANNPIPYNVENLPIYGVLLDMVGGSNARFHYEAFSQEYAAMPTAKVWSMAARLGYGNIFIPSTGGAVTDDHIAMIRAGIPTTDIIENNNVITGSFPPTWHTANDDMSNISRTTLEAVGKTVLNVVLNEQQ